MRNQRDNRRNRRQRKSRTKAFLVGGIFVALFAVIGAVLLLRGGEGEGKKPTAGPVDNTTIHLSFGGDLNITDDVIAAAANDGRFSGAFLDIANLLSGADLSVLNFEGSFAGAPYGTDRKSAPAALAKALKAAGVDLLQIANSYSVNNGLSGLISTIDTIRAAGIEPLGAYRNREEAEASKGYTLVDVKGVKVAFVAFTKGMHEGTTLPVAGCVNLLYKDYNSNYQKVDTEGINRVLSNVKAAGADIVVATVHWGSEYNDTISSTQKKICDLLQLGGVDVIVGTHPHYVQKMVFDKEKGTFVAYSLGDFFGDGITPGTEYSVLLDLEITKNNATGETTVTGYDYTPIFTLRQTARPLRIVRIAEAMKAYENHYVDRITTETYDAMKYALTRISARVEGK